MKQISRQQLINDLTKTILEHNSADMINKKTYMYI
jgi:hypothetical protein